MYLKGITDRNVGLAHVTIREILEFLFQNYGNITQYDILENDKKLKENWDANAPIKMLFDQIDNAQDFAAAAGQPYTNNQLLTTAYNLVYAMGLFFDNCTLPTTSYMQWAYFLTIAKPGIGSQQTKKQWTTSKQHFNKPNENYAINNAPHNKPVSKPMGLVPTHQKQ